MARRTDDPKEVYLVIHGHFYQPPRENPWLETIEREAGADPFSNWNERIADECYRRNSTARVFDERGRVVEMVNNYAHLSFNFGPTLLSWIEEQLPQVYRQILDADRQSIQARSGHGNAIAQAYSHAILPLCNDRDRLTQIRWGRRDFAHRFGREPEALWLPETAIDQATLEDLIAEGMRFAILSPRQAKRVRPLGQEPGPGSEDGSSWIDVSSNKVDPRMPYRCFSRRDRSRYIDLFFYDGPVAHAISFEKVLDSSKQFVDKLWGAVDPGRSNQLVHAAVDGETFGHHLRHAERALSYAFAVEVPKRGFTLTNYGEHLERFPPTHEVELDYGPAGEGTSWSCAHGVGRWCRDCGCNAGSPGGWNQAWRGPLRRGIELVRDAAAAIFEEMGGDLFLDPWEVRDRYVEVLVDPSPRARERFLDQHCREGGATARRIRALKLLEMQRFTLLAQASCGWFFDDISGLEAVQILKYAARAVQRYEEISGRNLEQRLLAVLAQARSNVESAGTGADVYRDKVLPASVGINRLVAQYAITGTFRDYAEEHRFYGHLIRRVEHRRYATGSPTVNVGRLQVELMRTGENFDVTYALIHFGGHDFHCAVRPLAGIQEFRQFTAHLEQIYRHATITQLLRVLDAHFGETYYGLQHLLPEDREEVLDALFGHLTQRFADTYTRLYEENVRAVNALIETGLKVPWEFRMAAEYVLSRRLNQEVLGQRGSSDPTAYSGALEVVREARRRGYTLDQSECVRRFGEMLLESVGRLQQELTAAACRQVLDRLALAESLQIEPQLAPAQDLLFELIRRGQDEPPWRGFEKTFAELLDKLRISPRLLEGAEQSSS